VETFFATLHGGKRFEGRHYGDSAGLHPITETR
jgi:hypothetical protein